MAEAAASSLSDDAPERLLERYLAGDDDAFGELAARYETKLHAFIHRMVGDAHLAEDVFQQVFVKVAKNAASFDNRASFSTWIFRIARNASLDELRRMAKRRGETTADLDAFGGIADPRATDPLESLDRKELGERIRLALARLPETQREAFLLKEEGDLDFDAIGAILDCGRETAKSRFRLAVGKLRTLLELDNPIRKRVDE